MTGCKIRCKDGRSHVVEASKYQFRYRLNQYEFTRGDGERFTVASGSLTIPHPKMILVAWKTDMHPGAPQPRSNVGAAA